jgi:hypothetical protein
MRPAVDEFGDPRFASDDSRFPPSSEWSSPNQPSRPERMLMRSQEAQPHQSNRSSPAFAVLAQLHVQTAADGVDLPGDVPDSGPAANSTTCATLFGSQNRPAGILVMIFSTTADPSSAVACIRSLRRRL